VINHCALSLLLAVGLGVGVSHGQQAQVHDGYWWSGSTEDFRVGFATGYLMAMNSVADVNTIKCVSQQNGSKTQDGKALRIVVEACEETSDVKPFSQFGGFRVGQWSDGIDEFYKDFRNRGLRIDLAMKYVKDQLHGVPANELEDEVTDWRRSASK
jgi:hypothetical protein